MAWSSVVPMLASMTSAPCRIGSWMRSAIPAWKRSSLLSKFEYTAPLVSPASSATSSRDAATSPRRANTAAAASMSWARVRAFFSSRVSRSGVSCCVTRSGCHVPLGLVGVLLGVGLPKRGEEALVAEPLHQPGLGLPLADRGDRRAGARLQVVHWASIDTEWYLIPIS